MSDLISGIFSTMGSGPKVYTGVRGFQRLSSNSKDNSPDDNNKPKENRITRKKIKQKKVNFCCFGESMQYRCHRECQIQTERTSGGMEMDSLF